MLRFGSSSHARELEAMLQAIGKAQAVIEFELDGTIITANENFLKTMGYTLEEIKGKHHSMFVEPGYRNSAEYQNFWATLGRGEYQAAEYKRIAKGGREVCIQASYNPILDRSGKPIKVVKFATDITEQKLRNADYSGQIDAIGKSQAVIEFNLDGTIITANENFLNAMGYTLDEIKGKHHSMFVDPAYRESAEYKDFWAQLGRGEYPGGGIQAHRQGRQGGLDPGLLQPDHGHDRQALQGGEVRHRHHRAEGCATPTIAARSTPSASRRR